MSEVKLTKSNFENEVLNSSKPVLVDFWATWCGPCQMIAPIVEEIAEEYEGSIKIGKVNVDEEMELAAAFQVTSIPTLMVFKNGKLINSTIGYRTKNEIIRLLGL